MVIIHEGGGGNVVVGGGLLAFYIDTIGTMLNFDGQGDGDSTCKQTLIIYRE